MKSSKFFQLYHTLTDSEIKAFEKYVHRNRPKQQQLMRILAYFKKHRQGKEGDKFEKDIALKKIFKTTVSKRNFNNLLSDLNLTLEEFLLWEQIKARKNDLAVQQLKLNIWKERGLKQSFYRDLEKIILQKRTDNTHIWTPLELMQLIHDGYYQSDAKQYFVENNTLQDAMNYLDVFYATFKLKYTSELWGRNDIVQEENTVILLEEIEQLYPKIKPEGLSFLELYYNLIQLKKTEDNQYFQKLIFYLKHFPFSDKKEQLTLLLYLANFGISRIKAGDQSNLQLIFDLYNFGLEEDIMVANKVFPPVPFKNIVALSFMLKKYDWVKQFIEKWSTSLPPALINSTYNLCKAGIFFEEQNFGQCLKTLRALSFNSFVEEIERRSLIIRSFYEEHDYTAVLDACQAYKKYLERNKNAGDNFTTAGMNLIKIMKKIIPPFDKEKRLLEIMDLYPLQSRSWFVNKLKGTKN